MRERVSRPWLWLRRRLHALRRWLIGADVPIGLVTMIITRRRFYAIFGGITLAFVIQGAVLGRAVQDVRRANRQIQQSRLVSCEQTYEGVRDVFKPFFPPHPRGKQKRDLDKFNRTVDGLKRKCAAQVTPPPVR